MGKIIKKYDRDFFVTTNSIFRDKRLSFQELGLLLQLLSLPDNWTYTVRGIAALHKDGKTTVAKALNDLIEHGYLYRVPVTGQKRSKKGLFDKRDYFIYDDPECNPYRGKTEEDESILSQNQDTDDYFDIFGDDLSRNRDTDNRNTDNRTIYSTKASNNKENKSTSTITTPEDLNNLFNSKSDVDGMQVSDKRYKEINDLIRMVGVGEIKDSSKDDLLKFLHKLYNEEKKDFLYKNDIPIRSLTAFVKKAFNLKTEKSEEKLREIKRKADEGDMEAKKYVHENWHLFQSLDW